MSCRLFSCPSISKEPGLELGLEPGLATVSISLKQYRPSKVETKLVHGNIRWKIEMEEGRQLPVQLYIVLHGLVSMVLLQ